MNRLIVISALLVFALLQFAPAQGQLLLHWKLDEADGDYTGGGYLEEVSGNSTISTEMILGTDVTEGQTGLAPDGGTSMLFSDNGDSSTDTYIDAGSVEDTGAYVSSPATTPYTLGANFTLTAWFNAASLPNSDRVILSSQFSSSRGFLFGTRGSGVFMDLGNRRQNGAANLVADQDYFMAFRQDPSGDTNDGWTTDANNRISIYDPSTTTWQHFDGSDTRNQLELQNLSIGRFTNGNREFNGLIDDVRVYDNTLLQADLDQLVGGGVTPTNPDGDYNNDGTVDLADYTLWRNNLGAADGTLPNDGSLMSTIGEDHYNLWRSNFGDTASLGTPIAAAVPEPSSMVLLASVLGMVMLRIRHQNF